MLMGIIEDFRHSAQEKGRLRVHRILHSMRKNKGTKKCRNIKNGINE